MHADDRNYTIVKNGVVVGSGTGPAIRVDGNRLIIRDGPQETTPLCLTRAEASRRLRHVLVCGHAGGFITFDALRWLRDTGVAFSQLDWDGSVVIASGPRGPDRPAIRRAQALVCSGVVPEASVAITREILRVKLNGQADVARQLGSAHASALIDDLAAMVGRETDGGTVIALEARAASIYWNLWREVPVRFARRNPRRLAPNGRWRPGRSDLWLTFGSRTSLLTGKPFRAATPGNALLNYLYAVLEAEMTVTLLAVGLDPGMGMFHADVDGRMSLALDAMEALRPHVDCWLLRYLASSAFANRDFTELSDGEVRLSHPLNSHLAHTAALWRQLCRPVADWLGRSFASAASIGAALTDDRTSFARRAIASEQQARDWSCDPLAPPSALIAPTGGRSPTRPGRGLKHDPVPRMCWECGKATVGRRRRFCSNDCAAEFSIDTRAAAIEAPLGNVG